MERSIPEGVEESYAAREVVVGELVPKKLCTSCGTDVTGIRRHKTADGVYYCWPCHQLRHQRGNQKSSATHTHMCVECGKNDHTECYCRSCFSAMQRQSTSWLRRLERKSAVLMRVCLRILACVAICTASVKVFLYLLQQLTG